MAKNFEKIVSLAKRRGFIYPGSEIYGGLGGFYDYGSLGVRLKFNVEQEWWNSVVRERETEDVFGVSAAIIMNPKVWEASGHTTRFQDYLSQCQSCNKSSIKIENYLDDKEKNEFVSKLAQIEQKFGPTPSGEQEVIKLCEWVGKILNNKIDCPVCGKRKWSRAKPFNLMLATAVGAIRDEAIITYLRPETAQGIFVNFKNVLDTMRVKIPFGIAQIGKAFRNEINPRDFIFRTREFEQMELEYFVSPKEDEKYFKEWVKARLEWYKTIGLKNVRTHEQSKEERAHYSKATTDIEYEFPFGWQEIEGVANRGDFDLKAHAKASGQALDYFDEETKERFVPYVIEPSAGVDRIILALLCDAYTEEKDRVVLKFHPRIAPYKVAIFPLLANKPKLVELAREIYKDLKKSFWVAWDARGNIGKRYYSQDEIGTPYCVTVDFESLENWDVTVRDRDTTKQERVKIKDLKNYLDEKLV